MVIMRILKKDEDKHELLLEDSIGHRFKITVNASGMPQMEECIDYNRSRHVHTHPIH